ncbi:MAG: hypothetical protein E7352_02730 [Clostridiales bacterium]|nr:hypothetical protein [Clostridiales bacterium]
MRRKLLIIILTVVLFMGAALLGVSATFRVDAVTLYSSEISAPAKDEAQELLKRLEAVYVNENMFNVKQSDANGVMAEFPYFRITAFKRDYPNRVIISIAEGEEVFAMESADGKDEYYILNGEGTVLGVRADSNNRLDGARNVLLQGYLCTGGKGEKPKGDSAFMPTISICSAISQRLNGLRANVCSVRVDGRANYERIGIVIVLKMQEGVEIYVYDVEKFTQEKAEKAVEAYLALSVGERLGGRIMVEENTQGEVQTRYVADGGLSA